MIVDERMMIFIDSMDTPNTEFLNQLEKYSKETNVPIIRPSMQSFLKLLLAIKQPKKILEVGTAIGFSALLMSDVGKEEGGGRLPSLRSKRQGREVCRKADKRRKVLRFTRPRGG